MPSLKQKIDSQYLGYAREAVYGAKGMMKREKHEKHFVIFGRGRSGSTLLVDLLNSNNDLFCDTEILNRPVFSPFDHIRNCSRMHKARIYGFKLLSYQLRSVQKVKDPVRFMSKLVEEMDYKLIYITRTNLLRQTLSKHYANFRNAWHEKGQNVERPMMTVDIPFLLERLDEGNKLYAYEKEIVSNFDHLAFTYENDLSSPEKHQNTIAQIAAFLDIPEFKSTSTLKKITGSKYTDFIQNYEEMASALKATPYAHFLED